MSASSSLSDRRRLAPRTSEDEALFIANKYAQNKLILEAKLANSLNGGRMVRQTMLDDVANELSVKFNVAARSRKYVEQKLRDMKKEARKFFYLQQNGKSSGTENGTPNGKSGSARAPPEPIRVMIEAMADELHAGTLSDDLDGIYAKQLLKSEKLDLDGERDEFRSRQSAASTSGESADGTPSEAGHGGGGADDDANGGSVGHLHHSNGIADDTIEVGAKHKTLALDPLGAASWQSAYGQSLTALMLSLGGGTENFPFISDAPSAKGKNDDAAAAGGCDLFAAALRQLIDGSAPCPTIVPDAPSAAGGAAENVDEATARELLKTLAASSLLLPSFYLQPPAIHAAAAAAGDNAAFFNLAASAPPAGAKKSAASGANHRSNHQKCRDDNKNVSNPCSPFSASVSSAAESPRLHAAGTMEAEFADATSRVPRTTAARQTPLKTRASTAAAAARPRRFFNSARFRHTVMRRLPSTQSTSTPANSSTSVEDHSAPTANTAAETTEEVAAGRASTRLALLKRRLLLEEINASRAFTTLCVEVRKAVDEAVSSFVETHRLHAQLLRAQLNNAAPPESVAATGEERRARKRKNPTAFPAAADDNDGDVEEAPVKVAAS